MRIFESREGKVSHFLRREWTVLVSWKIDERPRRSVKWKWKKTRSKGTVFSLICTFAPAGKHARTTLSIPRRHCSPRTVASRSELPGNTSLECRRKFNVSGTRLSFISRAFDSRSCATTTELLTCFRFVKNVQTRASPARINSSSFFSIAKSRTFRSQSATVLHWTQFVRNSDQKLYSTKEFWDLHKIVSKPAKIFKKLLYGPTTKMEDL